MIDPNTLSSILDSHETAKLVSREEILNYMRARIDAVRTLIAKSPPPATDELTAVQYLIWERELMIVYGRAVGTLTSLQALGHVSVPEMQTFKADLMATLMRRNAKFQLDGT